MKRESSLGILKDFLIENGINIDLNHYLSKYIFNSNDYIELPKKIVYFIIADAYGTNDNVVKNISEAIFKKFKFYLGRNQKNQLKRYIDYGFDQDFEIFCQLISQDYSKFDEIKNLINELNVGVNYGKDLKDFFDKIIEAKSQKNDDRVLDYLLFIYSRLLSFNERRKLSLNDLFTENKKYIKKEFNSEDYDDIQKSCSDTTKLNGDEAIRLFNEKYIRILERNGGKESKKAVIYLNIDQDLFNKFNTKKEFYDFLFSFIQKAYFKVQNHKTLAIRMRDILNENLNLKWELYAYLTIFAENLNHYEEKKIYYKPWEICIDVLKHKFDLELNESEIKILTNFYSNEYSKDYLNSVSKFKNEHILETIEGFKKIYHGFSFIDCFVLKKNSANNSDEIKFIKNETELLLIFAKHKIDDRKIPCPVCGSLDISGNSYPEVGIKSWECKNPLCSERSKTNRGKRYSERTILMQDATFDFSKSNVVPKNLIKIWRKDLVETWNLESLYTMLIKYFSFVHDSIECINLEDKSLFMKICSEQNRTVKFTHYNEFSNIEKGIFNKFINSKFVNLFIYEKKKSNISNKNYNLNSDEVLIINDDSNKVLENIGKNKIHNMVTSPPYYNAREYSQWQNLFNYLNDMYQINLRSYDSLVDGGVFFYNIGDIFDNENTIVKSKMGEKRIALGAYTIFLFQQAGFKLIDNIIWYKGEPQSNRHKNDGNYSPYYQRPANCYEHMFIFKKGNTLRLNSETSENKLQSNIIKFTPVFKIGKGGVNRYGHTAPFPSEVPLLSTTCFTNKGEIVLDPFSGSGTSPITAAKLERKGIGIELNKEYSELSIEKAKEQNISAKLIT